MTLRFFGADLEGVGQKVGGAGAHAEGRFTSATGTGSHAEGTTTSATGTASHAEGTATSATGAAAHAEGQGTTATGTNAHAEGASTTAAGNFSHAQGNFAKTIAVGQHAHGAFNPAAAAATAAQFSIYVLGCSAAAVASSSTDITFDLGSASAAGGAANANVLVLPLKSAYLIEYSFVMRPNNNASASVQGAGWAGWLLAGRGNVTTSNAGYLVSSGGTVYGPGNNLNLTIVAASDSTIATNSIQATINNGDTANNFMSFRYFNATGVAASIVGTLRVQELVTNI